MASKPLLSELPEPDEPLPEEVPAPASGLAVLEEPGPATGVRPEESLPEAPEVPLEPEVVLEVSVPDEAEPDPEESPVIEPVELPELLVPEAPEVSELPLPVELLPMSEAPEVPDELLPMSEGPEVPVELLPMPEAPEESDEPLLDDSFMVVVVVVVVVPEPPDEPLDALLGNSVDAASFVASVVVVVVVCCAKPVPAIPIRAKKIAEGNFFILDPFNKYLDSIFRSFRNPESSKSGKGNDDSDIFFLPAADAGLRTPLADSVEIPA